MKKLFKISLGLGIVVSINACSSEKTQNIQQADWLIGTWESVTSEGSSYEAWKKISHTEFRGQSYMLKGTDTVVFETIQLIQEQSDLYYIPKVKDQNKGQAVKFKAKTISQTQLVFENPEHDFPQLIGYNKINSDSLVAEISGTTDGKNEKQTFALKRVK